MRGEKVPAGFGLSPIFNMEAALGPNCGASGPLLLALSSVLAAASLAFKSPSFPPTLISGFACSGLLAKSTADLEPTKLNLAVIFPGSGLASGFKVVEEEGGLGLAPVGGDRGEAGNFDEGEEGEVEGEAAVLAAGEEGGVALGLGLPSRGSVGLGFAVVLIF